MDTEKEMEKEMLSADLNTLRKLRSVHSGYNDIYKKDIFWKMYYQSHVNDKYAFFPKNRKTGQWKKAFMMEYSEIRKVTFNDIRQNDIWYIHSVKNNKVRFSGNFLCIRREGNIDVCAFIHEINMFDKAFSDILKIDLTTQLVSEFPVVMAEKRMSSSISLHPISLDIIKELDVVIYPYNKYLTLRINSDMVSYDGNKTSDPYLSTKRKEIKKKDAKKKALKYIRIIENGAWKFNGGIPRRLTLNLNAKIINKGPISRIK